MNIEKDLILMTDAIQDAVSTIFPSDDDCPQDVFEHRLNVTLKASIGMMAGISAMYIEHNGLESANQLFSHLIKHVVQLTMDNIKADTEEAEEEGPQKSKLH